MLEAVIFDIDGVMLDSVALSYRIKTKILREDYGIELRDVPDPHGENHKGGSLPGLLAAIKSSHGLAIDRETFTSKVLAAVYRELTDSNISADPQLLRLLRELKSHDVPLGVATSALKQGAHNKLRVLGITDFFQVIITADDITNHKPHPEACVTALAQLNASPAHSVIFEDSSAGVASAVAAGAVVVGCTMHTADKAPLAGTKLTIDNWSEVNYQRLKQLVA